VIQTTVSVTSSHPAACTDAEVVLDTVVRVVPGVPEGPKARPPLNLALVLDRSGSMAGARKLDYARQAAVFAVEQLLPDDRVAVFAFDDTVEVVAASAPATDRVGLVGRINRIDTGGSTALHAGWLAGATAVRDHLRPGGLNRVILLTDGQANVGLTDSTEIAADVARLKTEGVGTTAIGLGADYNEDLLEAMARAGDGNYYYVETPKQLPDIYQSELQGLAATVGRDVRLAVEPAAGVTVADVVNDLNRDEAGRLMLANLIAGMPAEVVVRLRVAPRAAADAPLARFVLTWSAPQQGVDSTETVLELPAVPHAEWTAWAVNPEVRQSVQVQEVNRLKREATRALDGGDSSEARRLFHQARGVIEAMPDCSVTAAEAVDLQDVMDRLERGDIAGTTKTAKMHSYAASLSRAFRGRPPSPPPETK
jgi:Ca-activated chloride channel family protein